MAIVHSKEKLCPEHYKLQHPIEEKEKIYCDICGKLLEYLCVTCQSYVDTHNNNLEFLADVGQTIKAYNAPQQIIHEPIKKTLDDWKKDKYLNEDDLEKLKNISEFNQNDEHSWEDLWFLLVCGWEAFKKEKEKRDKEKQEAIEKQQEVYQRTKAEEESKKRVQEEFKKEKAEIETISKEINDSISETKEIIRLYLIEWMNRETGRITRSASQAQKTIPRKVMSLLQNLAKKLATKPLISDIDDFFNELDKLLDKNVKLAYEEDIRGLRLQRDNWNDFTTELEGIIEKIRSKAESERNKTETKSVEEWFLTKQINQEDWDNFNNELLRDDFDTNGNYPQDKDDYGFIYFRELVLTLEGVKKVIEYLKMIIE